MYRDANDKYSKPLHAAECVRCMAWSPIWANITKHRGQVVVSWNQTSQVSVKSLELDDSHETISNQQTLLRGLLCHKKLSKTSLKRCS